MLRKPKPQRRASDVSFAVIRLRGLAEHGPDHKKTLDSLRLHHVHHATIVPEEDSFQGMLNRVEHHVTYGEIDAETATQLLTERGRVTGGDPLTDETVEANTDYGSIEELAQALVDEEARIGDLGEIKPVFRLAPARGGFNGKKRHFNEGGSLGYRGEEINALIERML